jgi:hypothetical protein
MTITHDHGDIVFQCDGKDCRETLETNTSNFESARNVLRRRGWKPSKDSATGEWRHQCAECQKGLL